MSYIQGFVAAVPAANKAAYGKHVGVTAPLFKSFGASRVVEAWGDDVPDGKVTDFKSAVKAQDDEVVVFAWLEYPDKAARDAANGKLMSDPRIGEMMAAMPFDAKRMIFGGFEIIHEARNGGATGYVDGSLLAVPADKAATYRDVAKAQAAVILEHGASRVVDAWGDDVPDGKLTDFKRAVKAKDDEKVVYCWVEWPDKAARDAGWAKVFQDPRMHAITEPYDGKRRVFGGFAPLFDN